MPGRDRTILARVIIPAGAAVLVGMMWRMGWVHVWTIVLGVPFLLVLVITVRAVVMPLFGVVKLVWLLLCLVAALWRARIALSSRYDASAR